MTMRCVVCDTKFEAIHHLVKTCSEPCKVARKRMLYKERYDNNRDLLRKRSLDYYYEVLRRPPKMKSCVVCGKRFKSRWGTEACSDKCKIERRKERHQLNRVARLRYYRKNREAIRQRRLERKVYKPLKVRSCVVCGAGFETNRNAKFCSNPCRIESKKKQSHLYNQDYYLKNRKTIREQRRKYQTKNPELVREQVLAGRWRARVRQRSASRGGDSGRSR